MIAPDGIAKVSLLPLPSAQLALPATLQLQSSDGTCFTASFGARVVRNDATGFIARADVP